MEAPSAMEDEDEELTFEGFLDAKMEDVELGQAESVYTLACSCLQDRKNQRPLSKQVRRGRTGVSLRLWTTRVAVVHLSSRCRFCWS